jgi:peptidoglycan/xylan/chitin deacetylase (PgdA/CDA1 family)
MIASDWLQIDEFKNKAMAMQQDGVEFISLTEAFGHIQNDWLRRKKYAVLTFDDGYASLKEILPWLEEHQLPVTLFINGKYLDGKSYRKNPKEQYLTKEELCALKSPLIEIGSHGWEHTDAAKMNPRDFDEYIRKNIDVLSKHHRFIPFHAYTWGKHTKDTDAYLQSQGIMPVYIDGQMNYNNHGIIHREIMN